MSRERTLHWFPRALTLPWSALFVLLIELGGSDILETAVGGPAVFVVGGAITAWLIAQIARWISRARIEG